MSEFDQYVSPSQAARELGLHRSTILHHVDCGNLQAVRDSQGRRHIRRDAVEQMKAEGQRSKTGRRSRRD